MNKKRLQQINAQVLRLDAITSNLQRLLTEEQDSHDAIPLSLQQAPNGEVSEQWIEILKNIINSLDNVVVDLPMY